MGYHTYDLAEFDLDAVGQHDCYLYFFTQREDAIALVAENIGAKAISITNRIQNADWRFIPSGADQLSPHAFWYASLLAVCPSRQSAEEFLSCFKRRSVGRVLRRSRPVREFCDLERTAIISIPRDQGDQSASTHDVVLRASVELIRSGHAQALINSLDFNALSMSLERMTGIPMYEYKNTIIAQTINIFADPLKTDDFAEIMKEIANLRKDIAAIPEHERVQNLSRDLKKLRELIRDHFAEKQGLSVQVSAGLEAFGSGVRILYKTNPLTSERVNRIRKLLKLDVGNEKPREQTERVE